MNHSEDRSTQGEAAPPDDRPQGASDTMAPVLPAQTGIRPGKAYTASVVCGLLFLAVVLSFGQTVFYDFVKYDDSVFVYANPIVLRGVTAQGLIAAFTGRGGAMPYPLTLISYMLDTELYGTKPWGYHLTNVLLHAATTLILFKALWRMTGNLWPSALVAILFAVHPLRAETVAWVGDRKGALSGLFFVWTIAAYAAYARRPFSLARYLAVMALFALTLLAKPQLVTLPFLLLLLDYWPLGRWQGTGGVPAPRAGNGEAENTQNARAPTSLLRLIIEKIPLQLLVLGGAVGSVLSQAQVNNIMSLERISIPARIANALVSYTVYLGQLFWPAGLAAFYPRSENLPVWQVGGACLVLTALSLAAVMSWRRQPAVLVGWLWYLGTLVPMIGLVPIGNFARADRYTYLPHIGLCITLVWGVPWAAEWLWRKKFPSSPEEVAVCAGRWLYGVGGSLLVAGWMACAWQQTSYWRNTERLWTHALACTSSNVIVHANLAEALAEDGRIDEAIAQYELALKIEPAYAEAHNNLAAALASRGRIDEAITHYQKALQAKPDYAEAHNNLAVVLAGRGRIVEALAHFQNALEIQPDYAEAHYNLGLALAGRGQVAEAIVHYHTALAINPDYADAHYGLAVALAGKGQVAEAIIHYRKTLASKPDFAAAHYNLGTALLQCGQVAEAIVHYRKVLRTRPGDVDALNNTAWLLATQPDPQLRDGAAALTLARRAAKLAPGDPNILGTLAVACAEAGRFTEAAKTARQAVDLAVQQGNRALAESIRGKIPLYEAGQPFHESPPAPAKTVLQP